MKIKELILNIIKHVVLYILANAIGLIVVFNALSIIDDASYILKFDLMEMFVNPIMFTYFAMIYTIIPYVVILPIIKLIRKDSLWLYSLGGALTGFFVFALFWEENEKEWLLMYIVLIAGGLIGYFYGLLDKKVAKIISRKLS